MGSRYRTLVSYRFAHVRESFTEKEGEREGMGRRRERGKRAGEGGGGEESRGDE